MPTTPYTNQSYSTLNTTAAGGMSAGAGLAGMSLIQGISGAYSAYQQGKANKMVAESNRRIAEMKARDALKRGHETEARSRQGNRKVIGSQRAALAAQGIRVDFGSAADIQTETANIGELDALTIKNNALREAFGYTTQGQDSSMQGRLAYQAIMTQGMDTLLTSGVKAAGYYREFR